MFSNNGVVVFLKLMFGQVNVFNCPIFKSDLCLFVYYGTPSLNFSIEYTRHSFCLFLKNNISNCLHRQYINLYIIVFRQCLKSWGIDCFNPLNNITNVSLFCPFLTFEGDKYYEFSIGTFFIIQFGQKRMNVIDVVIRIVDRFVAQFVAGVDGFLVELLLVIVITDIDSSSLRGFV